MLKLIYAIQYRNGHPNCSHSLHQVILTEYTVILTSLLSILTILFVNNDTRTFHYGTDIFIDKYLPLRAELKILSKLQAFAGCVVLFE